MQSICVVIPMYNEADCLPTLAARLRDVLPDLSAKHDVRFHLIFVDDGSKDETLAVLGAQSFGVPSSLIVLSRNFGKEAALTAGLDRVTGDAVIFLDADLQHPPELISGLITEWQAGHDMGCTYVNSEFLGFSGRPLDALLGNRWTELIHPDGGWFTG